MYLRAAKQTTQHILHEQKTITPIEQLYFTGDDTSSRNFVRYIKQ